MSAVSVSGLSKRYLIGHQNSSDTLRDAMVSGVRSVWHRLRLRQRYSVEEFWALRDVNFEVNSGEVVGIIGRNGAGKSTLLKILSRITEPTEGRISINGRVASLLEVGTGFHPELSGRENIFLNGAILGMSRNEIKKKFDEIVEFAEVERFLDTPVKRYSSGMYVRLAFAVAAHLEPEILIVDEVLAVGDFEFQRKCLGRMEAVAKENRTVLFVSHNMAAVQRLCSRCILLRQGQVEQVGSTAPVVQSFLTPTQSGEGSQAWSLAKQHSALQLLYTQVSVNGRSVDIVRNQSTVTLHADFSCSDPSQFSGGMEIGFVVYGNGQKLTNFWTVASHSEIIPVGLKQTVTCTVPAWPFRNMQISIHIHLNYKRENMLIAEDALTFKSVDGDPFGTGVVPDQGEGPVLVPHTWSIT